MSICHFFVFCLFVFLIVLPSQPSDFFYHQHILLSQAEQCLGFATVSYTGIHVSDIKSCIEKK